MRRRQAEKGTESMIKAFMQCQQNADEAFYKYQQEQCQQMNEVEERRRREEREDEFRLMQMILQTGSTHGNYAQQLPPYSYTDFDYASDY